MLKGADATALLTSHPCPLRTKCPPLCFCNSMYAESSIQALCSQHSAQHWTHVWCVFSTTGCWILYFFISASKSPSTVSGFSTFWIHISWAIELDKPKYRDMEHDTHSKKISNNKDSPAFFPITTFFQNKFYWLHLSYKTWMNLEDTGLSEINQI